MKTRIFLSVVFIITSILLKAQVLTNVCAGDTVYLHISSPALSAIQWQEMGTGSAFVDIAGATNDTLVITGIQTSNFYRAKITGQECAPYYSEVKNIIVNPLPIASISGLQAIYCSSSPADTLTLTPAGGTLSGNGVSGNTFIPAAAGVGTHSLTYSVISSFGCKGSITQSVNVVIGPVVSYGVLNSNYCINASPVTLTGTPAGGSFSGNGMNGSVFNPLTAGVGTHTVSYAYTDPQSQCSGSHSQQVTITNLPTTANAGSDITATSTTVQLNANTPLVGNGVWSILSGSGGNIANVNNPQSSFTGTTNSVYQLRWAISNVPCPASVDTVQITMPTGSSLPSVQCGTNTLFVHPTDNGTSVWGCSGMASGATSTDDGAANTALVVQMCSLPNAAYICDTLNAYGFSDWYLPSYNELECLRQNAASIGGFSATSYWSSTEGSGILYLNAYHRTFPSGTSGAASKSSVKSLRCVRK